MTAALVILALVNGGWMVFDGLHAARHGRYFGPERVGPWGRLVEAVGLRLVAIWPVFVVLGGAWLAAAAGLALAGPAPWLWLGLGTAILTLWYLPVGTLVSLAFIGLALVAGPT